MTAKLRLLEDRSSIARHLEAPAAGRLHRDGGLRILLADRGRQTGGPWLVVSNGAELDLDGHLSSSGEVYGFRVTHSGRVHIACHAAKEESPLRASVGEEFPEDSRGFG
jgi:hypothetical protein